MRDNRIEAPGVVTPTPEAQLPDWILANIDPSKAVRLTEENVAAAAERLERENGDA